MARADFVHLAATYKALSKAEHELLEEISVAATLTHRAGGRGFSRVIRAAREAAAGPTYAPMYVPSFDMMLRC